MTSTIIAALLPIVVTLFLGYFAGWHRDFDAKQGGVLNRMVMLYALPLSLFAGMMGIERSVLLQQGSMALLIVLGMVGGYFVVFIISRFIFRRETKVAALQALSVAGPAVPFVGVPVLGFLYGPLSSVPIALCSIVMNLVQVPITIYLLSHNDQSDGANASNAVLDKIKSTIKEPVVWAPIIAFILLMLNISIPKEIRSSLQLLGGSTGGVALFASGIILFSYHVMLNTAVCVTVIAKNIILPVGVLVIGYYLGIHSSTLNISIIALAIPSASICTILAVQYKTAEQEMASTLFFSTLFSIITMAGFLLYLK